MLKFFYAHFQLIKSEREEAFMDQKSTARDRITDGVIWKEMLIFFLPIMAGALLQQVYNTTDAIIIGRALGKEALASVGGSSGKIIALLVNFLSLSPQALLSSFHSILGPAISRK